MEQDLKTLIAWVENEIRDFSEEEDDPCARGILEVFKVWLPKLQEVSNNFSAGELLRLREEASDEHSKYEISKGDEEEGLDEEEEEVLDGRCQAVGDIEDELYMILKDLGGDSNESK